MSARPEDTPETPDIAAMSFEKALAELEAVVRLLEGGEVELDAAVAAYERGAVLRRHCEGKLAAARERVEQITEGADGALSAAPLPDKD